jgi:hypothetical protein
MRNSKRRTFVVIFFASCALTASVHAQGPGQIVPVRLDVNGNFRIAPPYAPDPAFTEKSNVPKGRVIRFTMNSAESRIFSTAPVGGGTAGGRAGGDRGGGPAQPQQHQTFERQVAVYAPAGYVVALQRNATAPNGAWDFHQTFIPNSERKPLRIWLHVSENDLGANSPAEQMRNWVVANTRMAEVLKTKGYPYQFVFSEAAVHVDRRVEMQTMSEAFEWLWKGYKPSVR